MGRFQGTSRTVSNCGDAICPGNIYGNRIEIKNIWIRLLINGIGVCSIRVIPIRKRILSANIPYEPNNTQIFQRVKKIYASKY